MVFAGPDGITPIRNNPHQKSELGARSHPSYPPTRTRSTKPQTKTFPDSFPAPPLAWVHAFAKQGAALSSLPLRARTPPTRAACPCACCDESQPARPGILQPPGTRASLQQTSASATSPSRAMTLPALSRNEQPHWTSPNLQPWQPWRRVPNLAPCTATLPRGGTHPEGMNNTGPAKRDRYCNASRSSRKHTARAHLSRPVPGKALTDGMFTE
jgi:hypothetical protein